MIIIITRPYPDGVKLVNQLIAAGLSAHHLPLFTMPAHPCATQLQSQLNNLSTGDIVIAVSPRVITSLKKNGQRFKFPKYVHYAAIGEKTATLFQKFIKRPVIHPSKIENSEALLALPLFKTISHKRILILRGNQGREWLANKLAQRGAIINYITCYQKIFIHYSVNHSYHWPKDTIITVTSTDSLHRLNTFVAKSVRQHFILVISSQRIANEAIKYDWSRIILSPSADNKILFKTILTLCHNEKGLRVNKDK